MSKKNKYKQLNGKHTHPDETVTKEGDVIVSDDDLQIMFPKRFRSLTEEESEIQDLRQKKKKQKPTDVTEEFPETVDLSLKVFRLGNKYKVVDQEGSTLSDSPLTSKKAVSDFIAGLEEEEPEPVE
jgi:hypothetical protein